MAISKRVLTYTIPESFRGMTVEAFLRSKGYSRSVIYHLRNTGTDLIPSDIPGLLLNSEKAWLKKELTPGDTLTCTILETESSDNVIETELPLDIVYEDEDLMVINKPSDMPIHPSMGHYDDTLANALCWYTHHVQGIDNYMNRVINRLDRNTSGLLISAKNMLSAAILGDMVRAHTIDRKYIAICKGNVNYVLGKLSPENIFTSVKTGFDFAISAPIARKEESVIERVVDFDHGDPAITHVKLLDYNKEKDLSLIMLKLETGRTHQIRVHMRHIGHPLIGDFLYNPDFEFIGRQALHSRSLSFMHPVTGEEMYFTAPLPEDMQKLFPDFR